MFFNDAIWSVSLLFTVFLISGNRSLPIHCIIEQMNGAVNFENASSSPCDVCAVELDSYAILPATTPLRDLVRTALVKLGYTAVDAMNAKGAMLISFESKITLAVLQ